MQLLHLHLFPSFSAHRSLQFPQNLRPRLLQRHLRQPKMMHMTFYWGKNVTILVDSWRTDSWISYLLSLLAVFLASGFYQYLEDRRIRLKLLSKSKPSSAETPFLASVSGGRSAARISTAVIFGVNAAIGYLLMLAVMSFNGGVFLAAVFGLALGYYAFRSGAEEDLIALDKSCACS